MQEIMRTSKKGVNFIKGFEGLELEAYMDIAGVWTIGYGHTSEALVKSVMQQIVGLPLKPFEYRHFFAQDGKIVTTKELAEDLLRQDLKPRERAVRDLVSVPLNQNEFDALVSFVYNIGAEAFRKSTARKRLNRGDRIGAAEAMTWWNKATIDGVKREVLGLTRRRAAEKALFLKPVEPLANDHRETNVRPPKERRPLLSVMGWRGWIFSQCDPLDSR